MLLTVVTFDIFVEAMLPKSYSVLWLEIFMFSSWVFVFLGAIRSLT